MKNSALAGIVGLAHNHREARIKALTRHSLQVLRQLEGEKMFAARRAYYGGDSLAYNQYATESDELTEAISKKQFGEEA